MKIALDPGHGGIFSGAIGVVPFEVYEKDITLAICTKISKLLRAKRYRVVLTRKDDSNFHSNIAQDLEKRANIANRAQADLLVSIHCNAFSDPHPEGIECWYQPDSQEAESVARAIQNSLTSRFANHLNRGTRPRDLLLFRYAEMPACHIETEFLTNPDQLEFLASEKNQEHIAAAIAEGILQAAEE